MTSNKNEKNGKTEKQFLKFRFLLFLFLLALAEFKIFDQYISFSTKQKHSRFFFRTRTYVMYIIKKPRKTMIYKI